MTGRKSGKAKKRVTRKQAPPQANQEQQLLAQSQQQQQQQSQQVTDEPPAPNNIKKEQPPPPQVVKKILKTENEEKKALKMVFKSDPDSQMKDFIKIAARRPATAAVKALPKTPAETHPPAVAQELLDTDDDVADNLTKLFKTSKSYKTV